MGTAHPNLVPYQVFSTSNGDLMLAVGNDAQFKKCCDALGLDYLKKDDRFFTMSKRIKNRNILIEILQKRFLNDSAKNWLAKLLECKVPAGPVNDIKEVLTNEYAVEKNLVKHIKSTSGYEIPLVSNPVCFEHTPVEYKLAPPLLGEHTDKILNEWLGYSDSKVNSLKKSGVI